MGLNILKDHNLTAYNTFGVPSHAKFFVEITSEEELSMLLSSEEFQNNERLFIGGGSNILILGDFDGIVILNSIKGIETLEETDEFVLIKAMSGEVWHDLVQFSVDRGLWGIENLALIPGTVGAAPMQNIGAYGSELKDTLLSLDAVEISTGNRKTFLNEECQLGYRDSVFKNNLKGKYFILSITLRLSKIEKKNIEYKVLKQHLAEYNIEPSTSKIISEAVSDIRRSKLPDPKIIGNAGSFFKNPFVSEEKFQELQSMYGDMPSYLEEGKYKIPAGWLIEQSGPKEGVSWKGYRVGNVGVHDRQALVLVNHGGALGLEIKKLADEIIDSVYTKFGIKLTPEVNLI